MALSEFAKSGFLRLLAPVVDLLVRKGVSPNAITTFGTVATIIGGGFYARGHIMLAGWIVGLSAICALMDGAVARKSGKSSAFGAFYDSTLDRRLEIDLTRLHQQHHRRGQSNDLGQRSHVPECGFGWHA